MFFDTGPENGAWNMAFDHALLEGMINGSFGHRTMVLRTYSWKPWCISLGRFQKIEKPLPVLIDPDSAGPIQTVRRQTGGRAVLHADEITYSVVLSEKAPLYSASILETYKNLAEVIVKALAFLGIKATVTPARTKSGGRGAEVTLRTGEAPRTEFCFSSPSHYELTWNGLKIAGSAQVRSGGCVLQHGSLPLVVNPEAQRIFMKWCGLTGDPLDFVASLSMAAGRRILYQEAVGALKIAFGEVSDVGISNSRIFAKGTELVPDWLSMEADRLKSEFDRSCI